MATTERVPRQEETKRYLVICEDCSFEHAVQGDAEATQIGTDHQEATGHNVVAIEAPPSTPS